MVTLKLWDLFRLTVLLHQKLCSRGQVPGLMFYLEYMSSVQKIQDLIEMENLH